MNRALRQVWLLIVLAIGSFITTKAQTVTLYNGDPNGGPDGIFDGNVFQSGNQIGDATLYAVLSGGAQSFQIVSPGESLTRTVTASGYFSIRPTGSTVIDKTKILNFSGTVTGSVTITVKPLSITTISANVVTETAPGSEITVSYLTGPGTFPVDLAVGKFKVQLLDGNGNLLYDLLNSTDQYTATERFGTSRGGTRTIKATIPVTTTSGTYRVRVITVGLVTPVVGSPSTPFIIRDSSPVINAGNIGTGSFCAATTVSFPFSTTGTFPTGNLFKVRLTNTAGTSTQDLPETSASSPIRTILPSTLTGGAYRFQIISTLTTAVSTTSTINIAALPTLTLSGAGSTSLIAGTQAGVLANFTGTPPWLVDIVDFRPESAPTYVRTIAVTTSPAILNPTLFSTSVYDKGFIKSFRDSGCGVSSAISGSAIIAVTPIQITTGSVSGTYCPGSVISVPFVTNSPLPNDAVCQVQLSDNTGNFQNGQIIGTGLRTSPISAILPQTLIAGAGYKVTIIFQKSAVTGAVNYNDASSISPTTVIVNRPDAPKVADFSFCSGSVLSSLTAVGTNLKWYADGSSQAFASAPVPLNDRSSRYTVSQTVNGCESAQTTLNISVKPVPSAPANNTIALCQGAQGQFSTTVPGALWYTSATGGVGTPQPPVLNNQAVGDQTFYLTQTVDGCESTRSAVKATVFAIPVAPTVQTPAPLCQYAVGSALSAVGQNLIWYGPSGTSTIAPIPETSVSGTVSYSVSQRINGCESSKAIIAQVIRPAPAMPSATSTLYCVGDVPRSLTATGTNLKWYNGSAGGTSSASSPPFFTEIPAVLTFYVTQTDNNACESQRLPVSVSVLASPSAPVVTPSQAVCQFANVTSLTASPNTGLSWQGTGISGSSNTAPTPLTTQPATYTYLVTQKVGSCISSAATITYTVRALPVAPTVSTSVAYCIGQAATPLTAVATGQLTWYTAANHSAGSGTSQVIVNTALAGAMTYYVTQTDVYKCESLNSTLTVQVSAKSTARLSGDDFIYPGDSTAIRVRLSGNGPWTFTNWDGFIVLDWKDSLYVKWEKPSATRTYSIGNLSSTCGAGDILNSYTLAVRTPLSTQPVAEPATLTVYPNPTTGDFFADWSVPTTQPIDLQIINTEGKLIRQVTRQATGQRQTELFRLNGQPAGMYFLRLATPQGSILTRPIIRQ